MNKKQLYESIMRNVSKQVIKTLNEYDFALKMKRKDCKIEVNGHSINFMFANDIKNFTICFDKYSYDLFDNEGYPIDKENPMDYARMSKIRKQFDREAALNISYLLTILGCTSNSNMFDGGNIQTDEIDWPLITINQVDPYHKYDKMTDQGDLDYYIQNIYRKR